MGQVRSYPQATSIEDTDAFLIDRIGVGSMFIEAQDFLGGDAPTPLYDIAMGFTGTPAADIPLLVFNAVRSYWLPTDLPDSEFSFQTAPTDIVQFFIFRDDDQIGYIQFDADSKEGFVVHGDGSSFPDNQQFIAGQELKIVTPDNLFGAETLAMTFVATPGTAPPQ